MQQATAITEILPRLDAINTESEASMSLWLARFLEQSATDLSLAGAVIATSDGDDFRIMARHGISERQVEAITTHLKDLRLGMPARDQLARTAADKWVVEIGGHTYTVVASQIAEARSLWLVCDYQSPPGTAEMEMLSIVSMHLARAAAFVLIRSMTESQGHQVDKLRHDLREMQTSFLNITDDLQRKNRDLDALNQLSQEMTRCTSLPELAGKSAQAISTVFDGAMVALYVMDAGRSSLRPYHATGDLKYDCDDFTIDLWDDSFKSILRGEEIVFDSTDETHVPALAKAAGTKSGLVVPLAAKSNLLGCILVCETRWHRVFTEEERENLRVLAGTLAVAMENADLIARTAKQVEEMSLLTEYIETVVDSVDLAVLAVTADLRIAMINKGFERIYGRARDEFIGKRLFDAFPYLLDQGFGQISEQVLNGTPFVKYGWRRKVLDGKEVVQNIRIVPHRQAQGNIIGAVVIIEDITEKTTLEDQLAKSEAKFRSLVEDLGEGYLIVTDGKIVYANKAASQLTAIPCGNLLGMDVSGIFSDTGLLHECNQPTAGKIVRESRLNHQTGTWIPVEVSLSTCDYGGNTSVSMVIRDVTERKKFEKQLEQKNREMRTRNEMITRLNLELEATLNKLKESQENLIKSERLAAITETSVAANHEINNPLFSILGQAQLLLKRLSEAGGQDQDAVERLKEIEESALRIACVTKKLANLAEPVVKEYVGLATPMIDVDKSITR